MNTINMIGNNLKKARINKRYSQEEVAKLAFISQSYICKIEKGKIEASIDTILALCEVYEINMSDLICVERTISKLNT